MELKENFYKISKKATFLVIILLLILCIILGIQSLQHFGKDDNKNETTNITYTDKDVKDGTVIYLSNWHRSTVDPYDTTSKYDQNLYNLDVYVQSLITTTACVTVELYNDEVKALSESLEFDLLKGARVVKSTVKFDPNDLIYNGENFEDANLSWKLGKISAGKCK